MSNTAHTHGGARPGAGIRKHPRSPTRTISFRIPENNVAILAAAGIDNPAAFYKLAGEKDLKKLSKEV